MSKVSKEEHNGDMYETLSMPELKDTIIRLLKEIKGLEAEKKDFVESISATIKELKTRIDDIIYWVGLKETEKERAQLEEAAVKALKK